MSPREFNKLHLSLLFPAEMLPVSGGTMNSAYSALLEQLVGLAAQKAAEDNLKLLSIGLVGSSLRRWGFRDLDLVVVLDEEPSKVARYAERMVEEASSLSRVFEPKIVLGGYTCSYRWPADILALHIYPLRVLQGERLGELDQVPMAVRFSWSLSSQTLYGTSLAKLVKARLPTPRELLEEPEGITDCIESIAGKRLLWPTTVDGEPAKVEVKLDDYSLQHRIRYCVTWSTINYLRIKGHHNLWPDSPQLPSLARREGLDYELVSKAVAGERIEASHALSYIALLEKRIEAHADNSK